MSAPARIEVRLDEAAESGLANMMAQLLRQNLEEDARKRRLASRLRGRLVVTATDHEVTVTVDFAPAGIEILDGRVGPVDATISGPQARLTKLLSGEASPLWEHLRGRLHTTSSIRKPFFPLRVSSLMKVPPTERRNIPWPQIVLAAAGVTVLVIAVRSL